MAWTDLQKIKMELSDIDPAFPLLTDDTYLYYLEKNNNSLPRATLDDAKSILMLLSQRTDETVDIFTLRGAQAAVNFRLALQMYIRDPNMNPLIQNVQGYAGGISKADMLANDLTTDNNTPTSPYVSPEYIYRSDYFRV